MDFESGFFFGVLTGAFISWMITWIVSDIMLLNKVKRSLQKSFKYRLNSDLVINGSVDYERVIDNAKQNNN